MTNEIIKCVFLMAHHFLNDVLLHILLDRNKYVNTKIFKQNRLHILIKHFIRKTRYFRAYHTGKSKKKQKQEC